MAINVKKNNSPRARVMWFCTNCYGVDGSKILTLDDAETICKVHQASLECYSIICHDSDVHDVDSIANRESHQKQVYMEMYKKLAESHCVAKDSSSESGYVYDQYCETEAYKWSYFYYPSKKVGDLKELHLHVLLKFKNARAIDEIARWFSIPVNMIDILKGRHAFEDGALYLIHAKQPEKYQYSPDKVRANFDYPTWLETYKLKVEMHDKYHMAIDDIYDIANMVAHDGLSLRDVEKMISTPMLIKHARLFNEARARYIYEHIDMPSCRFVFYVEGDGLGGVGKSVAARALCKQFARDYGADPRKDLSQLQDYIYKVGQKGVPWEKYDGQPIVLIDDRVAYEILSDFGGHDGVKTLFEQFPDKEIVNVKYGHACIVAKYIIINGIQSYEDFVNGLNGTYKTKNGISVISDNDITQYTRRITGIIRISNNEITALFNKGVMMDTREYTQYIAIMTRKYNFARAIKKLKGDALVSIEERTLEPILLTAKQIEDNVNDKIDDLNLIPQEFVDYGTDVVTMCRDFDVLDDKSVLKSEDELRIEYEDYLDKFFKNNPTCRNTNNYPSFDLWLENQYGDYYKDSVVVYRMKK